MTTQVSRFYAEVQRNRRILTAELDAGKHPGQPKAIDIVNEETSESRRDCPFVWAASKRSLDRCTTEADAPRGKGIAMLPLDLFCVRYTEGSHRFATQEEIEQFAEYQRKQRAFYDSEDLKRRRKFEIALPGESRK